MFVTFESANLFARDLTLDTEKVTKTNIFFWMAVALLLAATIFLLVKFFLSKNFVLQVALTMGILFAAIMYANIIRTLIRAAMSSLSESSNPTADDAFKARSQVLGESCEFTLPEPLVL